VPRTDGVISLPSGLNQAPLPLLALRGHAPRCPLYVADPVVHPLLRGNSNGGGFDCPVIPQSDNLRSQQFEASGRHSAVWFPQFLDCKWIELGGLGRLIRRSSGMGGEIMNTSAMAFRRALGHAAQA
jgi:hypothetical protein